MELRAITDLARLKASTIVGLVIILGMILGLRGGIMNWSLLLGFLVGFFISASTNTINDVLDREIDYFEKPNRPIPRKSISVNEAIILFILETTIGLLIALYLNIYSFLLSASVSALSVLYSWKLKNIFLLKNLLTSFGISSALLVGVFATSPEIIPIDILLLFILIITVTMTFEIHKDIADAEWDGKNKKNTMPVILGTRKTAQIVFILYLIGIMLYHGILLSIGFQFDFIFWIVDLIIFLALLPLFKLISQHDNVDYVHKTRKITMGILSVVILTLIVNYMNIVS